MVTRSVNHGEAERAGRAPQQDRSRATRQRLLEAAIECLAEVGWSGSTVAVVAERAGVSRGAAQHHFPTREDLGTSAVEDVPQQRRRAPPAGSTGAVVAERAGVSRGAAQHHFPSREDLVPSAVEYVSQERLALLRAAAT